MAPAAILTRVPGAVTVTSEAAISQASLERVSGVLPLSLDTFDPPPGPVAHPGTVNVIDGGLTNQAMSLRAGERIAFDWTFFNGENVAANIQTGFNDMLLLVVAGPNDSTQVVQIASSEETGPNLNGGAADAIGTYTYTPVASGNYSFTWLVVNAVDALLESSASIAAPQVVFGLNRFADSVPFEISAQSADSNTEASLLVSVSGLEAGEAFTQGTDLGGGVWSFTADELAGLEFLPAAGFTGSRVFTVGASTVDPVLGVLQAPEQQTTVTVQQIPVGTAASDALLGGASDDLLLAGPGDDTLDGGAGADRLLGGSGNDILIGSTGSDTFDWFFGDVAGAGAPALDRIADFDTALPSADGDVLDFRDLLSGELKSGLNPGNLEQYLDFDTTSVAGATLVRISSAGGFAGGVYAAAAESQRVLLENVDLRAPAIFGLGPGATDNDIIGQLLQRGHLLADGP